MSDKRFMGEKRKKYQKFCSDAGRQSAVEIWRLGIEDNDYNGWFPEEKIPVLKRFCIENPEFHIMSDLDGYMYNCYIPDAKYYFLGNGVPTPNTSAEINREFTEEELLEFEQSEVFTEFREMQRDRGIPTLDELFPKKKVN